MTQKDLISVVIPAYKVEAFLDRCLQTVVNQTYSNLEIILVEDGSPDRCPEICDAWANKDPRVRVIHKTNGGLSDARNAGMSIASGEFVAFVDSDDYLACDMFEKLLEAIEADKSDIAACAVEMVWEDGRPGQLFTVQKRCVLDREQAQAALLSETLLKQPVWYKLYKREVIQGIPFEKGKYHEDVFWSYQVIGRANRVSLIENVGYYYTQRSDSIMGRGYSLDRLDALEAAEKRYDYIAREFPSLEKRARLKVVSNCIYQGQMALKFLERREQKQVFARLEASRKKYRIHYKDYSNYKIKRRLWFDLSRVSLKLTCRLRNTLRIGL